MIEYIYEPHWKIKNDIYCLVANVYNIFKVLWNQIYLIHINYCATINDKFQWNLSIIRRYQISYYYCINSNHKYYCWTMFKLHVNIYFYTCKSNLFINPIFYKLTSKRFLMYSLIDILYTLLIHFYYCTILKIFWILLK